MDWQAIMPKAPNSQRTPLKRSPPAGGRRLFFKLGLLTKRRPDLSYGCNNLDPVVDTPPEKNPSPNFFHSSRDKENRAAAPISPPTNIRTTSWPHAARVALMNEDHAEDAVVITTLDTVPFCCHEDLVTMSRDQLIGVALALNTRLPSALAIDTDRTLATNWIRSSIEGIVGLRPNAPQAPKVLRVLKDSESDRRLPAVNVVRTQIYKTPPTSPLACRSQSHVPLSSLISPGLDRLQEEDEHEDMDGIEIEDEEADRHSKKCKILFDDTEGDSDSDADLSSDSEQTPTPLSRIRRAQSHFLQMKAPSPMPVRVLRSYSQNVDIGRRPTVDTSLMQPQTRYRSKAMAERVARADKRSPVLKPIGAPRRSGRLRPRLGPRGDPARSDSANVMIPKELRADSRAASSIGAKRKRSVGSTDAARQVTYGLIKMTIEGSDDCDNGMDESA
ncbi:hypothetical protein C0991_001589 [Blastosporella zonata]|nr:hypothetical protein C0991_001589 [Blastosporella zonata]